MTTPSHIFPYFCFQCFNTTVFFFFFTPVYLVLSLSLQFLLCTSCALHLSLRPFSSLTFKLFNSFISVPFSPLLSTHPFLAYFGVDHPSFPFHPFVTSFHFICVLPLSPSLISPFFLLTLSHSSTATTFFLIDSLLVSIVSHACYLFKRVSFLSSCVLSFHFVNCLSFFSLSLFFF